MTLVISVVHTKGGVAKTTSSLYLAAAAVRRGLTATVYDADPQGSALLWAHHANNAGEPLPFPLHAADAGAIPTVHQAGTDLVVVDTPPGQAHAIDTAIDTADLVLIPTGASPLDLQRVWPTLEVTAHRPTAVILTMVDLRARDTLVGSAREVLDDAGVPVLNTMIGQRQHYRQAFGTSPRDLGAYPDALQEILDAA
jgi:chromosome partitioning protein